MYTHRTYRWATALYFFLAGIVFSSWASRIALLQKQWNFTDKQLGTVLFALPVGLLLSLPFAGKLVHRLGSKLMVVASAILYTLFLTCIAYADGTITIAITLLFFGALGNTINISVNTMAVEVQQYFPKSIIASFHGVWSLAGFVGAAVGYLAIQLQLATQQHFLWVSVFVILLAIVGYKFTAPAAPQVAATEPQQKAPLLAWPTGKLLLMGVICLCCMLCEGTMFDWIGVYFAKVVQAPKQQQVAGFVCFMFCMASGRFISDGLVSKLGVRKILVASGVGISTALALMVIFPVFQIAIIGCVVMGFSVSSVVPLVYGMAGKASEMPPSIALAAVSTVGYFGFLFGPPLIGYIADLGSLRMSFALVATLGLVIVGLSKKAVAS